MQSHRALKTLWIALCVVLFAAHFVHLRADFPDHSRWREWAKYTDEGWYGNAAINAKLRQTSVPATFVAPPGTPAWYVDGDFNPAIVLPVWPIMLAAVFHFSGVSINAARALSVSVLGLDCWLLFLLTRRLTQSTLAGLAAVTFALTSFYGFVFDRLAILEPAVTACLLASLLLALQMRERPAKLWRLALLGLACTLLLLVKTTGLFLLPAVVLVLRPDGPLPAIAKQWLRSLAIAGLTLALLYGGYLLLVWHGGYAGDFRYLFTSNVYATPTFPAGWWFDFRETVRGLICMGVVLPWAAVAATATRCLLRKRLPVFDGACWSGISIYLLFIFIHNNPQPRYYLPVAMVFILLAVTGARDLLRMGGRTGRFAGTALLLSLGASSITGASEIVVYLRHPQYTLVNAAQALTAYIDAHPNGNRLLLSTSGDEISLVTRLPAIGTDYGTWDLEDRIAHYQPGWFAAWNEVDYDTLDQIHTHAWLEQVASFPATDDPDRNLLILYKVHPLPGKDIGVRAVDEGP